MSNLDRINKLYGPDETGIERRAVAFCRTQKIWQLMKWPPVTSIKRQVRLGNAIADIVLLHQDGSASILEVKRAGLCLRDYCTGIGQLAYHAIMAISLFQTFDVRRILVAPWPISPDVLLACHFAGVEILPLPSEEEWQDLLKTVSEELNADPI
jgi:hypothetical protein